MLKTAKVSSEGLVTLPEFIKAWQGCSMFRCHSEGGSPEVIDQTRVAGRP